MSTSRNPTKLSDPTTQDVTSGNDFAYIRTRNRLAAFSVVHKEFNQSEMTQKQLAKRLGKDEGWLSRLLGAPGNWTLDTAADLLWAISGARIVYAIDYPLAKSRRNDTRPDWDSEMTWQPIETAPEGCNILLFAATGLDTEVIHIGYWDFYDERWEVGFDPRNRVYRPTHWMPLPTPPEKEAAE